MAGHSVSGEVAVRAVRFGKLTNDYDGTRVYLYEGHSYFVPEKLWRAVEEQDRVNQQDTP